MFRSATSWSTGCTWVYWNCWSCQIQHRTIDNSSVYWVLKCIEIQVFQSTKKSAESWTSSETFADQIEVWKDLQAETYFCSAQKKFTMLAEKSTFVLLNEFPTTSLLFVQTLRKKITMEPQSKSIWFVFLFSVSWLHKFCSIFLWVVFSPWTLFSGNWQKNRAKSRKFYSLQRRLHVSFNFFPFFW